MISFFCQEVTVFLYCQLHKTWNTNPFTSPGCHPPGLPSFISHNNYSNSLLNHSPAPTPIPLQFTAAEVIPPKGKSDITSLPKTSQWLPTTLTLHKVFHELTLYPSLSSYHSLPWTRWNYLQGNKFSLYKSLVLVLVSLQPVSLSHPWGLHLNISSPIKASLSSDKQNLLALCPHSTPYSPSLHDINHKGLYKGLPGSPQSNC